MTALTFSLALCSGCPGCGGCPGAAGTGCAARRIAPRLPNRVDGSGAASTASTPRALVFVAGAAAMMREAAPRRLQLGGPLTRGDFGIVSRSPGVPARAACVLFAHVSPRVSRRRAPRRRRLAVRRSSIDAGRAARPRPRAGDVGARRRRRAVHLRVPRVPMAIVADPPPGGASAQAKVGVGVVTASVSN